MAAGITTVRYDNLNHHGKSDIGKRITIDWTSDASGNVNGTKVLIRGLVFRVITNPDGTDAPTDNYDITFPHEVATDLDAFQSALLNRDTANTEEVALCGVGSLTLGTPLYLNGNFEFKVANAGDTKKGRVIVEVLH